jgi:integrase
VTGRAAPGSGPGLLHRLMGAVRAEFRETVLVFDADDPVFGGGECRIAGCGRAARGRGMCPGHLHRWAKQGRSDLEVFAATTDPRWQRQRPNAQCRVPGCGYGSARGGMCVLHGQQWHRAGRPELLDWLTDPPPVRPPATGVTCRIDHCPIWPQAALPFCHAHANTWKANGRPDVDVFAMRFDRRTRTEDETIRLDVLGPQLRLEIQYALQCRRDERTTKTFPQVVMQVVRFLTPTGVTSLLDRHEDIWRSEIGRPAPKDSNPRALLIYARRKVEDLIEAGGWEAEFPRDVWQLRRVGLPGNDTLDFAGIPQPWLRDLVKRWLRWRLSTGLGLEATRRGLRATTRFAVFCDTIGVTALTDVDRGVLERYLGDVHSHGLPSYQLGVQIGQLNAFLQAIRQHRWDDSLPVSAALFPDDHPRRPDRPPRALPEHVMAQIERPENLARWNNPTYQLVTIILIRCGLRVTDALTVPYDCVITDAGGAPYLRYDNHKMRRQALVPIDDELRHLINDQQARLNDRPNPRFLFPRPTKNPDGRAPTSSSTYRAALYRWLKRCDVRDEHGRPVHLTPHQWRHTLGTRLINQDVPQEVVRRLLDHDSAEMTAHYARLHDTTVRRHWEAARKFDINGQHVTLDPDGPLAEAAWAKQRLGRATQALPNGFCGLPVQTSSPHANACLTCPMFLTTEEFLPQHRGHRRETLHLITVAEANGQTRLAEMNRQVLGSLDRIISALSHPVPVDTQVLDAG